MKVPWKMSYETYEQYLDCIAKLGVLHPDYDYEKYCEAVEELASLKGFPRNYRPEEDIVVPVLPESLGPLVVLNVHE